MAGPTREQIYGALFALLDQKIPGVVTFSRRMALPGDVPPARQPALLLWEQPERVEDPGRGAPVKRSFEAWVVLYFQNRDKAVAGATILNPLLDAVEAALAPSGGDLVFNAQTLGGLVNSCEISGEIHKQVGDTDPNGQGGAVVPVRIVVP